MNLIFVCIGAVRQINSPLMHLVFDRYSLRISTEYLLARYRFLFVLIISFGIISLKVQLSLPSHSTWILNIVGVIE
jgi:hypothetical protein